MKRLAPTAFIGAILSIFLFGTPPANAAEVTLRLHTFLPPVANPSKHFMIPWAKKIGKASKGRIKVQAFWANQLGGHAPQLLDQVRDGVVDIVWTLPGFTPGRMPKIEVFELPFMHRDSISTTLAMQDYQDKHLGDELKDYKVLLINAPDGFLLMTKKPVRSLADFKGRKWRAANRIGVWMLGTLGATPVGLPLPRLPPSIAKGVITGSLLPFEIAPAVKMHELVSNFTQLSGDKARFGTVVFTFLMNKKSYNKLPPDLKKVIDDNSGRNIARAAGQTWLDIEVAGEKVVRSLSKNKLTKLSPAETAKIKKAVRPVFDRWFAAMKKAGHDGPALLADARAMLKKYAK